MAFASTVGYTFLASEEPTSFKLNRLGAPSIADGQGYIFSNTGFAIKDTTGSFSLNVANSSAFTANRTLTLVTGDAARTLTLSGNPTLADWFDQSVKTTASAQFLNVGIGTAPSSKLHIIGNGNYGTGIRHTNGGAHRWEMLHDGAEGFTFGYDGADVFFLSRSGATQLSSGNFTIAAGFLQVDGASTKTIKYTNATANAAVATTLGSVGPTGSTAGNPVGWMRVNMAGTDRYVPFW